MESIKVLLILIILIDNHLSEEPKTSGDIVEEEEENYVDENSAFWEQIARERNNTTNRTLNSVDSSSNATESDVNSSSDRSDSTVKSIVKTENTVISSSEWRGSYVKSSTVRTKGYVRPIGNKRKPESKLYNSTSINLCDDPSIDAAVRVSENNFMFVFKGENYWVLNRQTKSLSKGKKILEDFKNISSDLNSAWVGKGFDHRQSTSGNIYLLKGNIVYIFNVKFESEINYDIKFLNALHVNQFWPKDTPGSDDSTVSAVTELNTYHDIEGEYNSDKDLIVLIENWYGVLWADENQELSYKWQYFLELKSEKNSNRLSCFDPKTRDLNYWNSIEAIPMRNVLDIRALVRYPTGEVFAIGRQDYCIINIESSTLNVTCIKNSVRHLLCYNIGTTDKTTTGDNGNQTIESVSEDTVNPGITPTTFVTDSHSSTYLSLEPAKRYDSSNVLFYTFGLILLVFVIIVIIVLICFLCFSNSSKKTSRDKGSGGKGSKESIDPRYGQIDSKLNLSLKIADPSHMSLDKLIADQKDEIKSEPIIRKHKRKKLKK